jgi:hypothetical protein
MIVIEGHPLVVIDITANLEGIQGHGLLEMEAFLILLLTIQKQTPGTMFMSQISQ